MNISLKCLQKRWAIAFFAACFCIRAQGIANSRTALKELCQKSQIILVGCILDQGPFLRDTNEFITLTVRSECVLKGTLRTNNIGMRVRRPNREFDPMDSEPPPKVGSTYLLFLVSTPDPAPLLEDVEGGSASFILPHSKGSRQKLTRVMQRHISEITKTNPTPSILKDCLFSELAIAESFGFALEEMSTLAASKSQIIATMTHSDQLRLVELSKWMPITDGYWLHVLQVLQAQRSMSKKCVQNIARKMKRQQHTKDALGNLIGDDFNFYYSLAVLDRALGFQLHTGLVDGDNVFRFAKNMTGRSRVERDLIVRDALIRLENAVQ